MRDERQKEQESSRDRAPPCPLLVVERFSWRETLFSERGTFVAIASGYLLLWTKGSFLSVCQRYQDATDRYGLHASPIFSTRFASGRFRSRTAAESR